MNRHNDVQKACSGYEFAAGTVRGVRVWECDGGRLVGQAGHGWTPGENQAKCTSDVNGSMAVVQFNRDGAAIITAQKRPTMPNHGDPIDPRCTCGFYAYHHPDALARDEWFPVVGVIDGYGKTTVGTKGFRCEKARILAVVKVDLDSVAVSQGCGCDHCVRKGEARHDVYRQFPQWIARNYPGARVFDTVPLMLDVFPLGDIPVAVTS